MRLWIEAGKRNAPVDRARLWSRTRELNEDRWDLLFVDETAAPVLLPSQYRELALEVRVGLPEGHAWRENLPEW